MSNDGALNDSDADAKNTHGTPGDDESADTASGGQPRHHRRERRSRRQPVRRMTPTELHLTNP